MVALGLLSFAVSAACSSSTAIVLETDGGSQAGGATGPLPLATGGGGGGLSITLPGLGGQMDTGGVTGSGGCGGACSTAPRVALYCGDGLINQAKEICDDGNTAGGDG